MESKIFSNIVLIGMPGSGKSTVGIILAKKLCMKFVDTDVLIQTAEGKTLQDIINSRGLEAFLALEGKYICELDITGAVIAPGGSVVLYEKAMAFLKQTGRVVFLDTPLEVIRQRINVYTRGIVKQPAETIEDVLLQREPLYRKYADFVVECKDMNQMEIAQEICRGNSRIALKKV